MALTLKEAYQIKTVAAYQAADGTKFHDLAEAQAFTRRKMVEAAIDGAVKSNAQFARLDRNLLIDFALLAGRHLGAVMSESLAAAPQVYTAKAEDVLRQTHSIEVAPARVGERSGEQVILTNTPRAGEAPGLRERINTTPIPPSDTPKWGEHPLRQAMSNVDAQLEADIESEVEAALRAARD